MCNSNWFSEVDAAHPFAQGLADFSEDSVHRWSAIVNLSVIIWLVREAICFGVHLQRIYCKGKKQLRKKELYWLPNRMIFNSMGIDI